MIRKLMKKLWRARGLRFRLTALVLSATVIVLIAVTFFVGARASAIIERGSVDQLNTANRSLSVMVKVWLESPLGGLKNILALDELAGMDAGRQKKIFENMVKAYPNLYLVHSTDLSGRNVARSDKLKPKDYSDRRWFQEAKKGAPVTLQSLISKTTLKPALAVSMPIKTKHGAIAGVLSSVTHLAGLTEHVEAIRLGGSAYAYVIDERNQVLAHPDRNYTNDLRDLGDYPPVAALRQGKRGHIRFTDDAGIPWNASVNQLEHGWGIVVQQQERELSAPRWLFQKAAFIAIFVSIVFLFFSTWWVARRILNPIEELTEAVSGFAAQNAGTPAPSDAAVRETARGRDEVAKLAESFYEMIGRLETTMVSLRQELAERKRAEETVRESEEKIRHAHMLQERTLRFTQALLSAIPTPVFYKDREGKYLNCNRAFSEIMGVTPEQIRGKTVYELWPGEHAHMYHNKDLELMANPMRQMYEFKIRDKDGVIRPVMYAKDVFRDENDEAAGIVGCFLDITDIKRAEEEIRALNEALEQKVQERTKELSEANVKLKEVDRLKSMFLANMSHEIRTPMNGIIGMADLLMDTTLDREQQEFVKAVKSSADALLTIINDILDFSKIEAQKLELESMHFNLRDGIGDTLHTLTFRATGKGIELACDIPPDVPDAVIGDPGRLRQIIINLVGNAIKFTDRGEVVVSVRTEWIKEDRAFLHFVVSDTGIGISAEKQKYIFEAFCQEDTSTTRRYGGTGLGLTISARLVELMGGHIWVESEPGKGSRFHFCALFGLQKNTPVRLVPEKLENLHDLPVLVVDDNDTNRRIVEEMLKHWRMNPSATDNGLSAMEMIATARREGKAYRLLLLDGNMPGMDGFDLAERIRQEPDNNNLVIMVLTSSGQRGDAGRCRALSIAAYLTKPVKQSSLLDAIMTVLGKTEPADAKPQLVTQHVLREKHRRLRILLAEDNAVNQKIATAMLIKRGHTVVAAGNGKEALAIFEARKEQPFDLILMDVQMPEMDGLETTASIRTREKKTGGHVPIIALTAHAMRGDRELCLDAGMDGYVSKPIKAEELFKAIDEVFGAN